MIESSWLHLNSNLHSEHIADLLVFLFGTLDDLSGLGEGFLGLSGVGRNGRYCVFSIFYPGVDGFAVDLSRIDGGCGLGKFLLKAGGPNFIGARLDFLGVSLGDR